MFGLYITSTNTWLVRRDGDQLYLRWLKWTHGNYGQSLL